MTNILITGANRGIGLEFCKQYLRKGNRVYACCRDVSKAMNLQQLKADNSKNLSIIPLDVESYDSIQQLKFSLKNQPLDILINNAGIFSFDLPDYHLQSRIWEKFFRINSIGPYLITQTLLQNLQQGSQKKIINISSDMGSIHLNSNGNFIPYRTSKAALNAITKSLAMENQETAMIFIALHPGWVRTDMGGPNGMLAPEESVAAMMAHIEKLTTAHSGKYYAFDGKELPW